jgi:hypothetical protein
MGRVNEILAGKIRITAESVEGATMRRNGEIKLLQAAVDHVMLAYNIGEINVVGADRAIHQLKNISKSLKQEPVQPRTIVAIGGLKLHLPR